MNQTKYLSLLITGFALFLLGFIGIFLNLIGAQLVPLAWLDSFGPGISYLLKGFVAVLGICLAYLAYLYKNNF
ncbi:MAG: hypothetical protein K1X49_08815 [Saprospiraceae bacterium]|jgi:hypothetical protein|nr:hypothetical protein [Saprospiraceae bacterium]